MSGWTVTGSQTGYSATINTTNYKVGNSSMKLTPPSSYGYVRMVKTVNWNMSAPDERGNFRFWVYVHGTGEPTDFSITMSNNQQYSNYFITYYNASYKFRYRPGWNLVNLRASDWRVGCRIPIMDQSHCQHSHHGLWYVSDFVFNRWVSERRKRDSCRHTHV